MAEEQHTISFSSSFLTDDEFKDLIRNNKSGFQVHTYEGNPHGSDDGVIHYGKLITVISPNDDTHEFLPENRLLEAVRSSQHVDVYSIVKSCGYDEAAESLESNETYLPNLYIESLDDIDEETLGHIEYLRYRLRKDTESNVYYIKYYDETDRIEIQNFTRLREDVIDWLETTRKKARNEAVNSIANLTKDEINKLVEMISEK